MPDHRAKLASARVPAFGAASELRTRGGEMALGWLDQIETVHGAFQTRRIIDAWLDAITAHVVIRYSKEHAYNLLATRADAVGAIIISTGETKDGQA